MRIADATHKPSEMALGDIRQAMVIALGQREGIGVRAQNQRRRELPTIAYTIGGALSTAQSEDKIAKRLRRTGRP
jgi:hypothetical protein